MKTSKREKALIGLGIAVAVLGAVYRYWVGPLYDRRTRLASEVRRLRAREGSLALHLLEYRRLKQREQSFQDLSFADSSPGSLLRAFEGALRELDLKRHLVTANPSHSAINEHYVESFLSVQLGGLRWMDMMRLLHKLEGKQEGIWVKKARLVVREGTPKSLDVELILSAFKRRA